MNRWFRTLYRTFLQRCRSLLMYRRPRVFKDMNEAIEAAKASQKIVAKMSLDHREKVISNIRKRSWRMQKSWPVWEFRRLAWEMSDIKF